MKKSSIYGILSIVLIVGMFFTGCACRTVRACWATIRA